MSVTLGMIASVQPIGYDGELGPYLHNSLGGTVPGLSFGVQRRKPGQPLLALEGSVELKAA